MKVKIVIEADYVSSRGRASLSSAVADLVKSLEGVRLKTLVSPKPYKGYKGERVVHL